MLFNKENQNFDKEQLEEITPLLVKALDNDPENVYLRSITALYLYFLDKKDEAINVLNEAADDSDINIKQMKAILFMEYKDYEKALDIIKDIQDERLISYIKIGCLYNLEEYREVITQADKYIENYSENTDVINYKNKSLEKLGINTPEEDFEKEKDDYYLILKAKYFCDNGDKEEALKYLNEIGNNAESHVKNLKAVIYSEFEMYDEALEILNENLKHGDNKFYSYQIKSDILLEKEEYKKALKCISKGLEIKPDDIELLNNKFLALVKLERFKEAEELQELIFDLEIAENKIEGSLKKATHRYFDENYRECLDLCYDVLDIDKNNAQAIKLMIGSIYGLEDLKELPQVLLRISNYTGDELFT